MEYAEHITYLVFTTLDQDYGLLSYIANVVYSRLRTTVGEAFRSNFFCHLSFCQKSTFFLYFFFQRCLA